MPRKKRDVVETTVRLPLELKQKLEEMAERHYRLLSQEIVYGLAEYVRVSEDQPPAP